MDKGMDTWAWVQVQVRVGMAWHGTVKVGKGKAWGWAGRLEGWKHRWHGLLQKVGYRAINWLLPGPTGLHLSLKSEKAHPSLSFSQTRQNTCTCTTIRLVPMMIG